MASKEEKKMKKPFDKKKWRTKKYSKKQKFQDWNERRKKAVIRDYYKELNKSDKKPLDKLNNDNNNSTLWPTKRNPHKEAQERYKQIQEEKKTRHLEATKKKEEINKALEEYKEKKRWKNKNLRKKTKKGQPVMKERLELLLEKIQSSICNNTV